MDQPDTNFKPEKPKKLTYKNPSGPDGYNDDANIDLLEIPDFKNVIDDSEFWDQVLNPELENENKLGPEPSPTSSPTYKISKKCIRDNNYPTKDL